MTIPQINSMAFAGFAKPGGSKTRHVIIKVFSNGDQWQIIRPINEFYKYILGLGPGIIDSPIIEVLSSLELDSNKSALVLNQHRQLIQDIMQCVLDALNINSAPEIPLDFFMANELDQKSIFIDQENNSVPVDVSVKRTFSIDLHDGIAESLERNVSYGSNEEAVKRLEKKRQLVEGLRKQQIHTSFRDENNLSRLVRRASSTKVHHSNSREFEYAVIENKTITQALECVNINEQVVSIESLVPVDLTMTDLVKIKYMDENVVTRIPQDFQLFINKIKRKFSVGKEKTLSLTFLDEDGDEIQITSMEDVKIAKAIKQTSKLIIKASLK